MEQNGSLPNLDAYDAILAAMSEPRSATVDGVTATTHSLPDLIAAAKYIAGQRAAASPTRGLKFTRLLPPSAE
jgi:hypothetical protein